MDISENIQQLVYDMNSHFNLLKIIYPSEIFLQIHLIKGHNIVGQIENNHVNGVQICEPYDTII